MGGYGSGRRVSFSAKVTVDRCLKLDVTTLREDLLLLQQHSEYTGISQQQVGLSVELTRTRDGGFAVGVSEPRSPLASPMGTPCVLEATVPQFGGVRWWFRCPMCQRRCRLIYYAPAESRFGCRACLCLTYPSQRVDRVTRLCWRIEGLKSQLGARGTRTAAAAPTPLRPKGMHRHRYERLVRKLRVIEARYWQGMAEQLQWILSRHHSAGG